MIIITDTDIELVPERECKNCIHYWFFNNEEDCAADNGILRPEYVCDDYEEV